MEQKSYNYTNCGCCFWYCHLKIIKGNGGLENKRTNRDYPNNYIIENSQNTEKSPGDLLSLKLLFLMLMWKILKE